MLSKEAAWTSRGSQRHPNQPTNMEKLQGHGLHLDVSGGTAGPQRPVTGPAAGLLSSAHEDPCGQLSDLCEGQETSAGCRRPWQTVSPRPAPPVATDVFFPVIRVFLTQHEALGVGPSLKP